MIVRLVLLGTVLLLAPAAAFGQAEGGPAVDPPEPSAEADGAASDEAAPSDEEARTVFLAGRTAVVLFAVAPRSRAPESPEVACRVVPGGIGCSGRF